MAILGKVSLKNILYFGVIETVSIILLCYGLAVSLGHRKAWLPMISGCGDHPPEQYFFRWGILVGSLFPMLQAVAMRAAGRVSKVTSTLGFVAGLCLSGVAVVQDNEANTVHSTLAVIFFICEDLKNFILVVDDYPRMGRTAVTILISSNIVASLSTIARIGFVFVAIPDSSFPYLAVFEWSNTAAILICEACVAAGVGSLFVGEIQDDEVRGIESDPSTEKKPLR